MPSIETPLGMILVSSSSAETASASSLANSSSETVFSSETSSAYALIGVNKPAVNVNDSNSDRTLFFILNPHPSPAATPFPINWGRLHC